MYHGSCLCQAVAYEVEGEIADAAFCHCSRCRKASGSAFASNGTVSSSSFKILQGETALKDFSTPAGVHRVFCMHCGSPIYSRRDDVPDVLRLRLGTLDSNLSVKPEKHIFAASKAAWHEIHDALPQHAER